MRELELFRGFERQKYREKLKKTADGRTSFFGVEQALENDPQIFDVTQVSSNYDQVDEYDRDSVTYTITTAEDYSLYKFRLHKTGEHRVEIEFPD